jgi:hypothetical protein
VQTDGTGETGEKVRHRQDMAQTLKIIHGFTKEIHKFLTRMEDCLRQGWQQNFIQKHERTYM